jgi:hypothetical protein
LIVAFDHHEKTALGEGIHEMLHAQKAKAQNKKISKAT